MRFVARLLTGQLTLVDVDEFLHQLQIVEQIFGDFCLTEATCAELIRRSGDLLEDRASKFSCGSKDPGKALELLREGILVDGDLELVGRFEGQAPRARARMHHQLAGQCRDGPGER